MSKQLILRYTYQAASSFIQLTLGLLIVKEFGLEILGLWSILTITTSFISGIFTNYTLYNYFLNKFKLNNKIIKEFIGYFVLNIIVFFLFNSAIPSNILIFAIIKNIEAQIAEANMRQAMNKGEIPLEVIAIKILMLAPLLFTLF